MVVPQVAPDDELTSTLWNQMADAVNAVDGLIAGTSPLTAGLTVTRDSPTLWALTVKALNATTGRSLNVLNPEGTKSLLRIERAAAGNDVVNINLQNDTTPNATTLSVANLVSASWLLANMTLVQTGNGFDSAAIRGVAYQDSGGSAMRALEGRAIRATGATIHWTWGAELNVSSKVAGVNFYDLVGAQIACGTGAAGEVMGNTGVLITGAAQGSSTTNGGWENFIRCMARDTLTTLWSVNELGATFVGNGTAAAPSLSFTNTTTMGFYRSAGGNIGIATAGVRRGNWDQSGNMSIGDGTNALATNTNNGFLFIPRMAGTPTGTPAAYPDGCAIVYDTSANKIWVYNGSWRGVVVA